MTPEVEIKFDCPPDAIHAVLLRVLHAPPRDGTLLSVYYDTPDEALTAAGASLRLRTEASGRTVQTLKSGQGLARGEVEAEVSPGHLDLSWPEFVGPEFAGPEFAGLGLAANSPDPLAPRFSGSQLKDATLRIHLVDSQVGHLAHPQTQVGHAQGHCVIPATHRAGSVE